MNEEMREREGIVDEEANGGWKVNIQGLAGRVADDKTKEHFLHKTGGIDFLILILYVLCNCKNETRLEDKKVVWFGWVCVKYRDMVMVIPWFGMLWWWYGMVMQWYGQVGVWKVGRKDAGAADLPHRFLAHWPSPFSPFLFYCSFLFVTFFSLWSDCQLEMFEWNDLLLHQ